VQADQLRAPGRWAMIWLVATEAAFFAYLLFSYYYLGSMSRGPWPPDGTPSLRLSLPNTIMLLASSATLQWAHRSGARRRSGRLIAGVLVTILLGIGFVAVQGREYASLAFAAQTDAYGSLFYTITGFHLAHVVVGLVMLLVIFFRAALGDFRIGSRLAISNVVLYWHFVDLVWLAVFTTLYLTPRLS
jgi:heme/copper-type cytochrome/quinol oxidase subunit 3